MGSIHDIFENVSTGWTNRETHAAYLELTGDAGLQRSALAILATAETFHGALTAEQAGDEVAGLLQRFLDELDDAGLEDEHRAVLASIGSMWRVNWIEVGAAFLTSDSEAA